MSKIEKISVDDLKNISGGYLFILRPRSDSIGRKVAGEYDTILITTPEEDLCLKEDTSWRDYLPSSFNDKFLLFGTGIEEKTIENYLKLKFLQNHGFEENGFDK